jgi:outer membrane scaffolding protein for murein synthesis (MipA/OmpV family)
VNGVLAEKVVRRPAITGSVAALACALATGASAQASSDPYSLTTTGDLTGRVGLEGQFEPAYPGARMDRWRPLPDVDLTYKKLFFLTTTDGLGIYAVNTDLIDFGPSIYFQRGRSKSDSPRLRGVGMIPSAPQARFNGEVNVGSISFSALVGKDIGPRQGAIAGVEISTALPLAERLFAFPSMSVNFGDGRYMQLWYGVSAAQAVFTGLRTYRPGAGLESLGGDLKVAYLLTKNWVAFTRVKIDHLAEAAAKSSMTQRRSEPTMGAGMSYRF